MFEKCRHFDGCGVKTIWMILHRYVKKYEILGDRWDLNVQFRLSPWLIHNLIELNLIKKREDHKWNVVYIYQK